MEPIHNKRIYTPPTKSARKTRAVDGASATAATDPSPATQNPEPQPYKLPRKQRRSGRDRRQGKGNQFIDLRSGRDRRKNNKIDIEI